MSCEGLRKQPWSGSPVNYVLRSGEQVLSQCSWGLEKGTTEQGCPTQCLLDSQIQIKGSWVEWHFSVVIHALLNWERYQVSYQPKNEFKVFFSAEKNFLFC